MIRPLATPVSCVLVLLLAACKGEGGGPAQEEEDPAISWLDSDGDNILDQHEGYVDPLAATDGQTSLDSDGDGTADYLDTDSDDDGVEDILEAGDDDVMTLPWDSDADGVWDVLDLDSDGNCIPDEEDGTSDLDGDGLGAFSDLDDDGDAIKDVHEIGEACELVDSDGDGNPDYLDLDADNDGVGDKYEGGTSPWEEIPRDSDHDGVPDYLDDDSDGDGFSDGQESGTSGNPDREPDDTDADGTPDFIDRDSDGDGLWDDDEAARGTDPYDDDSDSDGYSDGAEISAGTNPLDAGSVIEGLYVTVPERTSVEQNFEFELSIQMGDVAFLIDTTCSMSSTLTGMRTEFSSIVSELSAVLPDANYGVASFDDYAYGGYGSSYSGDKPFHMNQQITSDTARVQSALSALTIHGGSDGPESGMEGLYQTLKGGGYDQNRNGSYDASTDVKPFIASSGDPFGGGGGQHYSASVPGSGTVGGMGFRDYALPIVIYAGDNYLRDADSTDATYNGTPNGSPLDAGHSDVVGAANAIGAKLIGINVGGYYPGATTQLQALARDTNSYADTDGDGAADDLLVFTWSSSSAVLRSTIVNAIQDLVSGVQFSEITLEVVGDEHGFVTDIQPEVYTISSSATGQKVDFDLTFRGAVAASEEDQIFRLTLNVIGDGAILLDTYDVYVLVPGN